jgi:ubiquinone biosynthesis protein UbiJ
MQNLLAQPTVTTLNHLLKQNSWALNRLTKFSGKTARFDIAPFSFAYTILPDGFLSHASANVIADAHCTIPPSLLPRLALHDESAHTEIQSEGDTALLTEIFFLSRNLNWDIAEDLSRVTGDIAAERIVKATHDTQQQLQGSASNFAYAAAEYWTEERPLLAKPAQVSTFMQQVDTLKDDIARLEQRLEQLS